MSDQPALKLVDVSRRLKEGIEVAHLAVEVQVDLAWIFLREPGFASQSFGDTATRHGRLGKWITAFPRERLLDEAERLLPLVHERTVRLAKFTNLWNYPKKESIVAVYCLDQDPEVLAALGRLGWSPRWKSNRDTAREFASGG